MSMLAGRLLLRPGLASCRAAASNGLIRGHEPTYRLLAPARRVFASTPRHRKDDARARTIQSEVASRSPADESTKPETVTVKKPAKPAVRTDPLLVEQTVTNKEQRKADWAIVRDMAHYLWPKNDFSTRFRVGLSVALLVGAKVRFSIFHGSRPASLIGVCRFSMSRFLSTSSLLLIP